MSWDRNDEDATFLVGDALTRLKELPDESVNCCVTSPPYFQLRDYGVSGQIGMERTPEEYVAKLVAVFEEVRRTLRPDGTLWLNLGDCYAGTGRGKGGAASNGRPELKRGLQQGLRDVGMTGRKYVPPPTGYKVKDLIGVPWMTAFALRAAGWYLRGEVIWEKTNAMPQPVKDRPSVVHETLFLFSRHYDYHYDYDAVAEPAVDEKRRRAGSKEYRNKRSVWRLPAARLKVAGKKHPATFPVKLVEPCILAGCPVDGVVLDPFAGAGTVNVVAALHGRRSIGIELNPEYVELARKRLEAAMAGVFRF